MDPHIFIVIGVAVGLPTLWYLTWRYRWDKKKTFHIEGITYIVRMRADKYGVDYRIEGEDGTHHWGSYKKEYNKIVYDPLEYEKLALYAHSELNEEYNKREYFKDKRIKILK